MLERFFKKVLRRRGLSLWYIPAVFMWVISLFYRLGYYLSRTSKPETVRLPVPVISVGNVTVGGTGKTPMAAFLAGDLIRQGLRVGIVSSGWGRPNREVCFVEPGYKVQEMDTDDTGDEVKLLACRLPDAVFSVHRIKAEAAHRLQEHTDVDVVIVDDGFQHRRLERDIDLVTFDAAVPRRMLRWFPFGLLREPLRAMGRADIIVATRTNFARDWGKTKRRLQRLAPQADVYAAQFVTTELVGQEETRQIKYLEDKSVYLFAGVGNFKPLRRQVEAMCADLDVALELSDHQQYDAALLQRIKREADEHDSDVLITTGKDWVKLPDFAFDREIYYLGQAIDLDPGEERLIRDLTERLGLKVQGT